jgi:transcriptional regulator with XRE-family HTH domain
MTQLELGNAISYSDKAISKWERGEAVPDAYVLLMLSEIFGVSVDFLLHEHGSDEALPKAKKTNFASVVALSIIAVWTAFAIAYITVYLASGYTFYLFFMFATVISFIMSVVFNSLWGKPSLNMLFVSLLVSSIITMIYLLLLSVGNLWQILLLIIPAVLIVICCFRIRIRIKRPAFLQRVKRGAQKEEKTE